MELWSPLSRMEPEQEETMRKGGYYSIQQRQGLRLIIFNTNFMCDSLILTICMKNI
jgi:hypothetical protein